MTISDEIDLSAAALIADQPDFTPVPVRARSDGWTPERQRAFLDQLMATGSVAAAAAAVGLTARSAYRLRDRDDAAGFRKAWASAVSTPAIFIEAKLLDQCINGVTRPIFYRGRIVGEERRFPLRPALAMLKRFDRLKARAKA